MSHLNIIYAAMLYVIDDEMFDIWSSTLEGRQARSINGMVGMKLKRIMDIAAVPAFAAFKCILSHIVDPDPFRRRAAVATLNLF